MGLLNMKKLLLIICLFVSLPVFSQDLDGKWIADGDELMFTFSNDSLYVDMAKSGCGISAYKLIKKRITITNNLEYDAHEVYVQGEDESQYREALIVLKKINDNRYQINYFGRDKDKTYNSHEQYHINRIKIPIGT